MKKTVKIIALFLAVLMTISGLSVVAFADDVYTIRVALGEGGFAMAGDRTVYGGTGTSVLVNRGESLSFDIIPDQGYAVDSFEINGSKVSISGTTYTMSNITANADVVITFKASSGESAKQYNVGVSVGNGGSVVVGEKTVKGGTNSNFKFNGGSNIKVNVTPDAGYEIDSFKVNGAAISGSSHSINGISSDTNISVTFKSSSANEHTVKVSAGNGGSVVAGGKTVSAGSSADISVKHGESLAVTVNPANGYALDTFKVDGKAVTVSGNSYTVKGITETTTVEVSFKSAGASYNLQLSATGNGSISVGDASAKNNTSQKISVDSSKSYTVNISPDNGYRLKSLTVNGTEVKVSGNSYTLSGISGDTTISAVFGIAAYYVTFNLTGKGSITVMEKDTSKVLGEAVNDGSKTTVSKTFELNGNVKFSVNTNGSYEIVCGEPHCANVGNLWFFSPVSCDSENNIVFSNDGTGEGTTPPTNTPGNNAADHTVKVTVGDGGSVVVGEKTVNGGNGSNMLVASGESLAMTIVPNEGYELKSFTVNGVVLEPTEIVENTYAVEKVEENLNILVTFQTIGGEDPNKLVTAESIDWTLSEITIDVNDKEVSKDVFDKIAALEPAADKYVTFVSENGCFYVPYGGASGMTSETLSLAITPLTEGVDYSKLLENYGGNSADFKAYSFAFGTKDIPAGTKISFNLGSEFADKETELLVYENSELGLKESLVMDANGVTEPVYYSNESILVCGVVRADDESSEDSESSELLSVVIDDGDATDDSEGGNNTLIVVLVIVLVAVLGAAALFIVKWRQEKF